MRPGVEFGAGDAAVWTTGERQDFVRSFAGQRFQRCDLRALRDYCGGTDHPLSRSQHSCQVAPTELSDEEDLSFIRAEEYDARWVPCRRPFVATGGELTLEMLDLRYETTGHFYEAPLHLKALGGCFVIDDFGRQLVSPTSLLNRWIVPLENRVDYLKLHTGKSFSIPFEELVIFSTNMEPEELMDPAFLRRLPYKIEVGAPSLENYRHIFEKECVRQGMTLPGEAFNAMVQKLRKEKGLIWRHISRSLSWIRWRRRAGSWARRRTSSRGSSSMR